MSWVMNRVMNQTQTLPGQTVPWNPTPSPGGISIDPGGISGCANVFGVPICGSIPFNGGAGPSTDAPPAGAMPDTNLSPNGGAGPCPEGYVRIGEKCFPTNPGAYLPGGQPAMVPSSGGPIPKVPAVRMVTPILPASMAKPAGFVLNKTGYYRKDPLNGGEIVYIPPKSVWRRSRRRNPANARATSRALSRIESAKKLAKSLSHVSIRKSCKCK